MFRRSIAITFLPFLLAFFSTAHAYSVLSHEALIDSAWDTSIRPLLVKRFPDATADQLRQAHGYTYGGAIIQDMGYYPHGSHFYSDLTHYVRSGDFIVTLIRDSQDLNEYAFALGALAHYAADNDGHRIAVNRAVPMLFPKLKRDVGAVVTYEDDPTAHLKTEFGFDVLEIAKQRYAPDSYHDFIGFNVSQPLLERAFEETYSLPLRSLFNDLDAAVGSYRHTVSTTIPKATRIAWAMKKDEIQKDVPGITRRKFTYNLSRASFEKEWGRKYQPPGTGERFLAFLLRILPKIGPLKALAFHTPTPETEKMFMASFDSALDEYRRLLAAAGEDRLQLPNRNFDTGSTIQPGSYFMQDDAYGRLLGLLSKDHFQPVSAPLRLDILAYFAAWHMPARIRWDKQEKTRVDWKKVSEQITELKAAGPQPVAQTLDLSNSASH